MGRVISQDKLTAITAAHRAHPKEIGPALGHLVLNNGIPVYIIADVLAVSNPTIYRWMYGETKPLDRDKVKKIEVLLATLRLAKRVKVLPLYGSARERRNATLQLLEDYKPVSQ